MMKIQGSVDYTRILTPEEIGRAFAHANDEEQAQVLAAIASCFEHEFTGQGGGEFAGLMQMHYAADAVAKLPQVDLARVRWFMQELNARINPEETEAVSA